jgi:hypothetical protein
VAAGRVRVHRGVRHLRQRQLCPRCGSRLFLLDPEGAEIQLGSLDEAPFELRPEAELWIKRREPWIPEVEGASQHVENR